MTEYFDILDRNANPTGQTAITGTPLGSGMYYLGVNGYIALPEGKFLIQRRAPDKKIRPGCWDILMGHVRAGEVSEDAVIRETREETGLITGRENLHFIKRYFWPEAHLFADIYFIIASFELSSLTLQPDEVTDVKLIKKEEMTAFVRAMMHHKKQYRDLILETIGRLFPDSGK